MPAGRPRKYQPDELLNKFQEYKQSQQGQTKKVFDKKKQQVFEVDYDKPLTLVGFCVFAGIHKDTLNSYKNEHPEYSDVIKNIYQSCEADLIEKALIYDQHAAFTIHILNNAHGYITQQKLEHTGSITIEQALKELDEE